MSTITLEEISACHEDKRLKMNHALTLINYNVLKVSDKAEEIATKLIENKTLRKKSYDDALHIGVAIVASCDCIISWNFKHIVNIKTIKGIRIIENLCNYKPIEIWQPSMLLKDIEEND